MYQLINSDKKYQNGSTHFDKKQKALFDVYLAQYSVKDKLSEQYLIHKNRPALDAKTARAIQKSVLDKQHHEYKKHRNASMLRYAGAIGLTLLAISAIPGVGQAVLVAGIAISAAVAIGKAYHVYSNWNDKRLKKAEKNYIQQQTLIPTNNEVIIPENPNTVLDAYIKSHCNTDTQYSKSLFLHYEKEHQKHRFNRQTVERDFNGLSKHEQEQQLDFARYTHKKRLYIAYIQHQSVRGAGYSLNNFLNELDLMESQQVFTLLKSAKRRYQQDNYLCDKVLGHLPHSLNKSEYKQALKQREAFLQSLSNPHRIQLLKQHVTAEQQTNKAKAEATIRRQPFNTKARSALAAYTFARPCVGGRMLTA